MDHGPTDRKAIHGIPEPRRLITAACNHSSTIVAKTSTNDNVIVLHLLADWDAAAALQSRAVLLRCLSI